LLPGTDVRETNSSVYVIRSRPEPTCYYVGLSTDIDRRLAVHNSGGSIHTVQNRPWDLVVSVEFTNRDSAAKFERYLKSGSGRAFAKRHFV
jgi:predicted GIY-YIG superfamily endonuclease